MSRRKPSRFNGLLPVLKRSGPTSHDVVDMARKALRERRIGHTGTLDPMAEGLLLLCVGQATRLQQYLLGWRKSYQGRIELGHATTTYDAEGEVIDPQGAPPALEAEALHTLAAQFTGEIDQLPPPYSAKKVGGKKLYELARDGQAVQVEPKRVTVHSLSLDIVSPSSISLDVSCSTGFYVRSLAHDIGKELGCGAFLRSLLRTRIGPYVAERAVPQEFLQEVEHSDQIISHSAWIPVDRIALPNTEISLNPAATERFTHGQEVMVFRSGSETITAGDVVAVRGPGQRLLGMGTVLNVLARGRTLDVRPCMVLAGT